MSLNCQAVVFKYCHECNSS